MRKTFLMTTGLAWLALTGAASATVAVSLTPGPMDPQYFASEAAGQNGFTIDGITWNGTDAATAKGTTPNISAAPLGMGTDTTTGTTYMSVEGGGVETATWATTQTSLSIYWGSIDGNGGNLNSISISMGAYTLTGMQLAMMGADGSGNQTDPLGNQLITITGLDAFTTASFSSTANAFEFSLGSGVPEPSTWAMMAIGFFGLGYAAFLRNTKSQPLSI